MVFCIHHIVNNDLLLKNMFLYILYTTYTISTQKHLPVYKVYKNMLLKVCTQNGFSYTNLFLFSGVCNDVTRGAMTDNISPWAAVIRRSDRPGVHGEKNILREVKLYHPCSDSVAFQMVKRSRQPLTTTTATASLARAACERVVFSSCRNCREHSGDRRRAEHQRTGER